jgi:hypothetical protein
MVQADNVVDDPDGFWNVDVQKDQDSCVLQVVGNKHPSFVVTEDPLHLRTSSHAVPSGAAVM